MFPPQSTPSKRPKRRVESYRIYKRPYSACSQSSRPSPSSYEKATNGRLVGPTLSTPRGDNNYNQYRPLCEVCPRDRDKVVGTLQGKLNCKFDELDKLECKFDELAKLECKFDEMDKLRMSSMSLISWTVSLMSWISCTVSWMSWISWTVSWMSWISCTVSWMSWISSG